MRYSRFNAQLGHYDVFEDQRTHAMNADLPTPKLTAMAGGIGVPSVDAGRDLPPGAKRVGTSWNAVGMVVRDEVSRPMSGLFDSSPVKLPEGILLGATFAAVAWWSFRWSYSHFSGSR